MATSVWNMPTSEAQAKEIKLAIESTHYIMQEINVQKDQLKDIFDDLHGKYGIPKRVFNALCNFSFYGNSPQVQERNDEIMDAWNALEKVKTE